MVTDEVYEAIARRSARELVLDNLDGEDVCLSHRLHRLENEVLVHVVLQAPDPQCSFPTHCNRLLF